MSTEINIPTVVRKAAKGDRSARQQLYAQFSKAMFSICMRMAGNRDDAEDILQEAFIIAFNKMDQLKDEQTFGGWLRRIVVNECIRYCKQRNRWQAVDDEFDAAQEDEESWFTSINMADINEAIKSLPDGCRQIFNLYVVENYSHRVIAETVGISESTSKSQYQRARQLLKERLLKKTTHG